MNETRTNSVSSIPRPINSSSATKFPMFSSLGSIWVSSGLVTCEPDDEDSFSSLVSSEPDDGEDSFNSKEGRGLAKVSSTPKG